MNSNYNEEIEINFFFSSNLESKESNLEML